jgi:hypothetical protein
VSGRLVEVAGVRAWLCDAEGPPIASERDAADVVGDSFAHEARLVILPLARLAPAFLDLKTRLAGEVLQKFVNYHRQVVVLGDVSAALERSAPLRDFVRESNRGGSVWFVDDLAALEAKLAQA